MKTSTRKETAKHKARANTQGLEKADRPKVEIWVWITWTSVNPEIDVSVTYKFTTTSARDGARRRYGGTSSWIRWRSENPFLFIPEDKGDWQRDDDWPDRLFVPPITKDNKNWAGVLSKPHKPEPDDMGQGFYLDLSTRAFSHKRKRNEPDEAGYWIIPVENKDLRQLSKVLTYRKVVSAKRLTKLLEEVFEVITGRFAAKATIIISQ